MKLSEEVRRKHRWLLKELTAISKELEEMEESERRTRVEEPLPDVAEETKTTGLAH